MKTRFILFLSLVIVFAFSVSAVLATNGADQDTQALFEKKCSSCHGTDRAKSKQKTSGEWESTVMRMKNERRAKITDGEAQLIIDYLVKNYGRPITKPKNI